MELQNINHPSCPICNSRVKLIEQDRKHTNGSWFESMAFECGAEIKFTPNFMMEEDVRRCPNHPDETIKQELRIKAKNRLLKYINKLDVDKQFKKI